MLNNPTIPAIFLRIAIAVPFLWFSADRVGWMGAHGQPGVSWGDWQNFMEYAKQVMKFLPSSIAEIFAVIATAGEVLFGLMLLTGLRTRLAAFGSGVLTLLFALSMAFSFGIVSPLAYSVFTVSAASFLLSTVTVHQWSVDSLLLKSKHT